MRILLAEDEMALSKALVTIWNGTIIPSIRFMMAKRLWRMRSPGITTAWCWIS